MEIEMNLNEYLDNEILCKDLVNDYNLEACEKITRLLMKKFQRLTNSCSEEPPLRITSRYMPVYSAPLPMKNNSTELLDKHLDDIRDYDFMKQKITNIMNNMNSEERACFVEMFFRNKTDYTASKIIGRSRCGLIPFINSCIVRVTLAFHMEVMKDEKFEIDDSREIELIYY